MAEIHLGFPLSKRQRLQLGVTYSQPGCSDTMSCDTPPEYHCTQTSVAHTPAQESLWCARLNTYQEHRHNCKKIHKPKWLELIYITTIDGLFRDRGSGITTVYGSTDLERLQSTGI